MGTPQSYVPDGPSMRGPSRSFRPLPAGQKMLRKYIDRGHEASKVELMVEAAPSSRWTRLPGVVHQRSVRRAELRPLLLPRAGALGQRIRRIQVGGPHDRDKPDWCRPEHVDMLLSYGVTKVEIGVQSLRDEILRLSNRGHTVQDTLDAFQAARDAGLKVAGHMMPGLPGSNPEDDLADLLRLFDTGRSVPT